MRTINCIIYLCSISNFVKQTKYPVWYSQCIKLPLWQWRYIFREVQFNLPHVTVHTNRLLIYTYVLGNASINTENAMKNNKFINADFVTSQNWYWKWLGRRWAKKESIRSVELRKVISRCRASSSWSWLRACDRKSICSSIAIRLGMKRRVCYI